MQQLYTLIPVILMFGILYFMVIVPEKKRKKKYGEMLDSLKLNDEVMSNGGIIGKIVNIQDDSVVLESGPDRTRIKMSKYGIRTVTKAAGEPLAEEK